MKIKAKRIYHSGEFNQYEINGKLVWIPGKKHTYNESSGEVDIEEDWYKDMVKYEKI